MSEGFSYPPSPPRGKGGRITHSLPIQNVNMSTEAQAPLLTVNNIEVIYDHVILVLKGVSLEVHGGRIVALLGANGAGKSTTLKSISNLLRAERGEVTKGSGEFDGERIDQRNPSDVVNHAIVQVMEVSHSF